MSTNITWSFGTSTPTSTDHRLYAATIGQSMPGYAEHMAFRSDDGALQRMIPALDARVLGECQTFQTIDAHARHIASISGMPQAQALTVVQRLRAAGLMQEPTQRFGAHPVASTIPQAKPLFVIRTYCRPAALHNLLVSIANDETRLGIRRSYLIVDDAPERDAIAATCAVAQSARSELGLDVRSFHHEHHEAAFAALGITGLTTIVDALSARTMPSNSGGRSWNWALLLSAGRPLAILDDDVHFPFRQPTNASNRFSFHWNISAETRFPDAAEAWPLSLVDGDPYASAQQLLGCDAGTLRTQRGFDDTQLRDVPSIALRAWETQRKVVAVVPGIYGGLTFDSSVYLNFAGGDSLPHLWRKPYRHERLEADRVWHGFTAPRLLDHAVYTPMLMDGSELLPPTSTHGRADDTCFLALLAAIAKDAAFAHVPMSIGHAPIDPRGRLARSLQPLLVDANACVAQFIGEIGSALASDDRGVRLAAVAAMANDLALGSTRLADQVGRWRDMMIGTLLTGLETTLKAAKDAPEQWSAHVQDIIKSNAAMLAQPADTALVEATRRGLAQIASVVPHWTTAWQRAREGALDDLRTQLD